MNDPLIGKRLDEYRLEKLLGQGGMARVYRGMDIGLRRYAAIKVIDTPYRQDEDYIARFEKEARAIAQLDHPHIVTVYRYGRADNLLYLAMRYIEGADLLVILDKYEKDGQLMPTADVTRLVREIGSALDYAHKQGVVHRDIKPSNVMLNAEGSVYLTDFGLALLTDVGTMGKILGSPHYISPEQAVSSAGAVSQSDLYSLGVILFRMVTGRLPFDHEDVLELLMLHMTAEAPDPREFRPDVSPALAQVILRALAKEPAERYPSGRALSDALEAAVSDKAAAPIELSTLSILDRVALDMEMLPQIPAAVTPHSANLQSTRSVPEPAEPREEATIGLPKRPAANEPSRRSKSNRVLKFAAGSLLLLLLLLAAVYFTGIWEAVIAAATDGVTPVETVETQAASVTGGTPLTSVVTKTQAASVPVETPPTIVVTQTATSPPAPTATPQPAGPTSPSGEIYLPLIAGEGQNPVVVVVSPDSRQTAAPPTNAPPTVYQLLILTNKEDSLFLVNQSAEPFSLPPLRLENNTGAIQGTEWGVVLLQPGECVAMWKSNGNPRPPEVDCKEVGNRVTRNGPDRFWKDSFNIVYVEELIGVCEPKEPCLVEVQVQE